ncbi:MAG TPA: glycosyltransferase family 4 protein [Longimicrobiales bacterium]
MKIPDASGLLIVANWRSDVGYAWWFMERIWVALAEAFSRHGGHTHIIYPRLLSVPARIAGARIATHELDFSDRSPGNLSRLRELIQREHIKAVYLTDRNPLDPIYALLRGWGVQRIVINDQLPGDRTISRAKVAFKALAHRLRLFSGDLYIAPSKFVMDRFNRVYGIPSDRCLLIPNGIEPIDPATADRNHVRREFGIPADAKIVTSLSRAVHYKGIGFIIDCADRLVNGEGRADLYFVHCGDGPDLEEFRGRVRALGLEHRFFLPGARPDYRMILAGSDVAMHASQGEGFSLAVLECMSAGLGMLVPDNSGNREAVEHNVSGYCYVPGDVDEGVSSLRRLLDDDTERQRLGAAARAAVLEKFTLDHTLASFQQTAGRVLCGEV